MSESSPTPIINRPYMTFTIDTAEDDAARKFTERYGVEPEYLFDFKNLLWVGPVPNPNDEESLER